MLDRQRDIDIDAEGLRALQEEKQLLEERLAETAAKLSPGPWDPMVAGDDSPRKLLRALREVAGGEGKLLSRCARTELRSLQELSMELLRGAQLEITRRMERMRGRAVGRSH